LDVLIVSPTGTPNLSTKLQLELWNDNDNDGKINDNNGTADTLIKSELLSGNWTSPVTNLNIALGKAGAGSAPLDHHKVIAKLTFNDADNTFKGTGVGFSFSFRADQ